MLDRTAMAVGVSAAANLFSHEPGEEKIHMRCQNLVSNFLHMIKASRKFVIGKSGKHRLAFYDSRYPPTKFLKRNPNRINIKCILCGYPRTGTHWIMNVIEKSTGRKTYDTFQKKPTPEDKDVCLLKIHAKNRFVARAKALWLLPPHRFEGKYIYVYRDPRDAIISLYEMYKKDKNRPELRPEDFIKLDPIRAYRWEINAWVIKNHKDVLPVKFEDLKSQPLPTFQRILSYLDIDGSVDHESVGVKVATVDSKSRPRATAHGWKQAPPEYQYIIDSVNKKLGREIELLGYKDV